MREWTTYKPRNHIYFSTQIHVPAALSPGKDPPEWTLWRGKNLHPSRPDHSPVIILNELRRLPYYGNILNKLQKSWHI